MPETVFSRPDALRDVTTHYCPGCTHGTIHRLIAEVLDEFGRQLPAPAVAHDDIRLVPQRCRAGPAVDRGALAHDVTPSMSTNRP